MSWKDVLDGSKKHYGHILAFFKRVVVPSGYEFFTWNGNVYKVIEMPVIGLHYEMTNLTVDDLR